MEILGVVLTTTRCLIRRCLVVVLLGVLTMTRKMVVYIRSHFQEEDYQNY
jgi:hypothetical protein